MHVKAPIIRLHYLVQHDILAAFQVRMRKFEIRLRKFAFMHASIWLWIFDFMQPLEYIAHQVCWPEVCICTEWVCFTAVICGCTAQYTRPWTKAKATVLCLCQAFTLAVVHVMSPYRRPASYAAHDRLQLSEPSVGIRESCSAPRKLRSPVSFHLRQAMIIITVSPWCCMVFLY